LNGYDVIWGDFCFKACAKEAGQMWKYLTCRLNRYEIVGFVVLS